jgi:hypothetical protein
MKSELAKCVKRCHEEKDPEPCSTERIAFFEKISDSATHSNQPIYAARMRNRALELREKYKLKT